MPRPSPPDWWVVVPVKEAHRAKRRVDVSGGLSRPELARALARDTLEAVAATVGGSRVVLVTSDAAATRVAAVLGARRVPDPGAGLNAAVAAGVRAAVEAAPHAPVAVLLGDLPALRSRDLAAALALCGAHPRAVVPDADGTGTVLLTGGPGTPPVPRFGPGSASRHAEDAVVVAPDLARLRRDVDDLPSLAQVARLGVGRHTAAVLARAVLAPTVGAMQASVHTFDPETESGAVLLDTGRVLPFGAGVLADSGLRHLRMGQRVSIEVDGDPEERGTVVTRLWIVGIGPGERIR